MTSQNDGKIRHRGEVNIVFIGLPAHHQFAVKQGWNSVDVDRGVREDTIDILNAGYNIYIIQAGPEVSMAQLAEKLNSKEIKWDAFGIGMGVRAGKLEAVIHFLEDLVELFHKEAPNARPIFNNGPKSTLVAVKHRFPLADADDTTVKGKLIGWDEIFDGFKNPPLEYP